MDLPFAVADILHPYRIRARIRSTALTPANLLLGRSTYGLAITAAQTIAADRQEAVVWSRIPRFSGTRGR
ncbi:hypothetical protein [Actinoplanes sp. NPDC026623]|uniref:hypothetical protein n=1 Tax=Actinoplanes sp. NPDC026623 TaxID=3155610 RepID=UPI003410F5CD